jgi:hypothetical protein
VLVNAARWSLSLTLTVALLGCRRPPPPPPTSPPQPAVLEPPAPVSRRAPTLQPGERWPAVHYGSSVPARAALAVGDETWLAGPSGIARFDASLWRDDAPAPRSVIGVAEGLPAAGVNALARLGDGDILAATDDGLARIAASGRVRALLPPRGRVTALASHYAGTWNGLFDLTNNRVIADTADLSITRLSQCNGRLYIATNDRGLFVLERGHVSAVVGIGAVHVADLACAADARLWAATVSGLFIVDGKRARPSAAWTQHATAVVADGNDVVFGSFGQGAFRLRGDRLSRVVEPDRISLLYAKGRELLGSSDHCLYRIDFQSTKPISVSGPPAGLITALAVTDDGIAAGSFDHGLALLESGRWRALPLPDPRVTALLRDSRQRLWIGTAAGLFVHERGRLRPARDPRGWLDRHINALRRRGDELWVAAHPGLVVIDLTTDPPRHRYLGARGAEASADLVGGTAYGIAFTDDASWVGTDRGLTRLVAGGGARSLTDLDGILPENWINDVRSDGTSVWVLTLRSGLVRLGPAGTEVWPIALMTNPSSLVPLGERALFGTNSAGVAVADARTLVVTTHGPRQGLSSATVGALAYDEVADRMWIGGSAGIDRVDGLGRRWATLGGEP